MGRVGIEKGPGGPLVAGLIIGPLWALVAASQNSKAAREAMTANAKATVVCCCFWLAMLSAASFSAVMVSISSINCALVARAVFIGGLREDG